MARNETIPVYSVNWKEGDKPLFKVSFFKAVEMLKEEDSIGLKVYRDITPHWVHGKGKPMPVLQFNAPLREEHQTPCSLTKSVMEANAGVSGSQASQRLARELVSAYPFIGDHKAVRVSCAPA